MRHADFKALFESAVLTLVPGDAHDDTARWVLARLVLDVLLDRTTKESLKSEINFHRFFLLEVTKYMIASGPCIVSHNVSVAVAFGMRYILLFSVNFLDLQRTIHTARKLCRCGPIVFNLL